MPEAGAIPVTEFADLKSTVTRLSEDMKDQKADRKIESMEWGTRFQALEIQMSHVNKNTKWIVRLLAAGLAAIGGGGGWSIFGQ